MEKENMSDTDERSCEPRGDERGSICPIPDDDPVGFAILGLFLFPVVVFGMAAVAAFGGFVLAHAYHTAVWLLQLIAGKP
jgi:hypothetical protein